MTLIARDVTPSGREQRYWLHNGDDNKDRITVETIQDVEPVIDLVKTIAQAKQSKDFKLKAVIPAVVLENSSVISAGLWGVSVKDAFAEIFKGKSPRAKRVHKMLSEGRDFRKFQAKAYR